MLESMTGYGRGEHTSGSIRVTTEIRSVNNRYCEVTPKLPPQLQPFEQQIKDIVQKGISRGKISMTIDIEYHADDTDPVPVREDILKTRLKTLEKIKSVAGISEPVTLDHLLIFDELFDVSAKDSELMQKQYQVAEKAVKQAVEELVQMRRSEGKNLQKDLEERIEMLKTHCKDVSANEKSRIEEARKKMSERLTQLLDDSRVDEDRIEQEIAILADRLDISEELVRMDSHITYFGESLQSTASQGKKLNFILQEMHREINTIGSKAHSPEISRSVVEMKEIVENIREQIQNIA